MDMAQLSDKDMIIIWEESASRAEVAERSNLSIDDVGTWAARLRGLGIDLKRMTPTQFVAEPDLKEFIETWECADNLNEVAHYYGKSDDQVRGIAARLRKKGLNLRSFTPPVKRVTDKEYVRVHKESESIDDVAAELGLTQSSARSYETKLRKKGYRLRKLKTARQVMRDRANADLLEWYKTRFKRP